MATHVLPTRRRPSSSSEGRRVGQRPQGCPWQRPRSGRVDRAGTGLGGPSPAPGPSQGVRAHLPGADPQDVVDGGAQIFPSPIFPVRAASAITVMIRRASSSATSTSSLTFGTKSIGVLGASVRLGVAALAAEALDLADGDTLHSGGLEGVLHIVERERLDDCCDEAGMRFLLSRGPAQPTWSFRASACRRRGCRGRSRGHRAPRCRGRRSPPPR